MSLSERDDTDNPDTADSDAGSRTRTREEIVSEIRENTSTSPTERQQADAMPDELDGCTDDVVALFSIATGYILVALGWYGIFTSREVYYMLSQFIPFFVLVTLVMLAAPIQYVWGPSIIQPIIDKLT